MLFKFINTLIYLSFIKKCNSAAGLDLSDVQFNRMFSPATTCLLHPCICGPPLGNSKKLKWYDLFFLYYLFETRTKITRATPDKTMFLHLKRHFISQSNIFYSNTLIQYYINAERLRDNQHRSEYDILNIHDTFQCSTVSVN